jgi:hypothetical protein
MTWPPASVTAIEIAIPASRALSIAVAVILFAPSWVRRFVLVTYIWSEASRILIRRLARRDLRSHAQIQIQSLQLQ